MGVSLLVCLEHTHSSVKFLPRGTDRNQVSVGVQNVFEEGFVIHLSGIVGRSPS